MRERGEFDTLISRRVLLIGGAKIALTSLIFGRMYYLQVVEGKKYKLLADKNRISWRFKASPRGRLLDCLGRQIADNNSAFHLVVDHDALKEIHGTLKSLSPFIPLSPDQINRIIRDLKRTPPYIPTIIKDGLTWDEVTRVELHATDFPSVYVESAHKRFYPHGEIFAPITGYVSLPSPQDAALDALLKLPGVRVGQQGIEKIYQNHLQGEPAHEQLEVNARNRVVRKLASSTGKPGQDLRLTVDQDMQLICHQQMKEHRAGSCVVLDVETGAVKAMISHPSFDPNFFADGIRHEHWRALQEDPFAPLRNRAISALYPPASTFKMIVALAALEAGIINEQTSCHCTGVFELGNHAFHCWRKEGHGAVNLVQALATSCDVFFYNTALKLGSEAIARMARHFGFGSPTGIDLAHEKSGLVPDKAWKRRVKKEPWLKGDTVNYGIGQGFLSATPLQLACMVAALANGRRLVVPHLAMGVERPAGIALPAFDPYHVGLVRQGMYACVNSPQGTCFQASALSQGYQILGKTGSAQVKRIRLEDRLLGMHKSANRPWESLDHAMFVGYAPHESPRYALSLVVDHGGGGGRVAGPLGIKILAEILSLSRG